jgi:uncharacterized phage protein (TIGR02220 family)
LGIKRIVDTSFWTDGKVDDFSPEDKYFMLYLMTCPFTTQLGIYGISIKQIAFQLGYSIDTVRVLLDRFENKYEIIIYSKETSEIAIKNYLRHSIIKGGAPVRDCLVKEMTKVKNKDLIAGVFAHIKCREDLNETVKRIISEYEEKNGELSYSNKKDNDIENENENENEVSYPVSYNDTSNDTFKDAYLPIVSYLNQKAGTKYKATTPKTKTAIHARLSEGFTVDDFKTVIDKKCSEWLGDEKMERYLRPETLFGTKFEGYLNAKITKSGTISANGIKIDESLNDLDDLFY